MNFVIGMIMLVIWAFTGAERLDLLMASIIFAALYIPELYINKRFK